MKLSIKTAVMLVSVMVLTACIDQNTKFMWGVDEGKGGNVNPGKRIAVEHRPPLKTPPMLLGKIELPHADEIAVVEEMPKAAALIVKGKQVALNARVYEKPADQVFSATLSAMTGLNLPVQSVDSPSGTITTDWVRKNSKNAGITNILGGDGVLAVRYRFVTRVLRQHHQDKQGHDQVLTRFEVHTVAQGYKNNHWSNIRLARKYSNELFSRVEEEIGKLQAQ